ncbi:MAG: multicopper oxidase domain-containing protein [Proteobacteria bacterium]|nr:multicopper oxidase domain-containing protein [Pseudomonadota bacterium]
MSKKPKTPQIFSPSRRNVLKTGLGAAALFSIGGLTLFPKRSEAGVLTLNYVAETYNKTMVDGVELEAWQFRDTAGLAIGPGVLNSGLVLVEGETVEIHLDNNLSKPIRFSIPGFLENGPTINAGASSIISFNAPVAGTYLFVDDLDGELGVAMGLSGPMVVMPAGGGQQLYTGGPFFDRQYTLVLSDFDDRLNSASANGQAYDLTQFESNYYFVNGLSFPNTASDPETKMDMSLNEEVAIRFVNAGLLAYPLHFHGYHVDVISRNRMVETEVIEKDTVLVRPGECVDVILTVTQVGIYPLHSHYIPAVTASGVYLNPYGGALMIMEATI